MRFLSFLSGLSLGLLVAFAVFLRYQVVDPGTGAEPDAGGQAQAERAQPDVTFTFYDTLRNKKVHISEWMAADKDDEDDTTGAEAETAIQERGPGREGVAEPAQDTDREVTDGGPVYVLQAGSFKEYRAADQVKAELALLGIFAEIQRVMLNERDIRHRVRLGPFKNARDMRAVSRTLKDHDMEFLVLELREGQE